MATSENFNYKHYELAKLQKNKQILKSHLQKQKDGLKLIFV